MRKTLVMGIGNLLLRDDGVGVHAVKSLSKRQLPSWVDILDVGTAFLDALPALATAERVVVIDAVKAGGKPGDIYRLLLENCESKPLNTLHSFDIFGMLKLADNPHPTQVVVVGVEPEKIDWGTELSLQVLKALPDLVELVCKEIGL